MSKPRTRPATGAERAALVLLALGETHGAPIWAELSDQEIAEVTRAMARLGAVDKTLVGAALELFDQELSALAGIAGTTATAERIIGSVLPESRAKSHLERLRKPHGQDVWEKLSSLKDRVLADYLASEHPQTAAIVLSRIEAQQAARVLEALPRDFALDCLDRMMSLDTLDDAVLDAVETSLGAALGTVEAAAGKADPASQIASIFNALDKRAVEDIIDRWKSNDADAASRVRAQMFTFDDFGKLAPVVIQTLLRSLDRDLLALALKGATQELRTFFLDQMSMRAARMLEDQMSGRGAVRLSEAQRAQAKVVAYARELEEAGELSLKIAGEDAEEMVE